MAEVAANRKYAAGQKIENVAMVVLKQVVALPGRSFQILWRNRELTTHYIRIMQDDGLFAVVYERPGSRGIFYTQATLARVTSHRRNGLDRSVLTTNVAQQRVELVQWSCNIRGLYSGTVTVTGVSAVPDLFSPGRSAVLPPPIKSAQPDNDDFHQLVALLPLYHFRMSQEWTLTTNVNYIAAQMVRYASNWTSTERLRALARDKSALTYWLLANLPVDRQVKLAILGTQLLNGQMIRVAQIMNKFDQLHCAHCAQPIASGRSMLSVDPNGPTNIFVNPSGVICEVLTVTEVTNAELVGSPQTVMTWFEGYEWSVLCCVGCESHLGWKYTAQEEEEAVVAPGQFYGLVVNSLKAANQQYF